MDWKRRSERPVRASGLPCTIRTDDHRTDSPTEQADGSAVPVLAH